MSHRVVAEERRETGGRRESCSRHEWRHARHATAVQCFFPQPSNSRASTVDAEGLAQAQGGRGAAHAAYAQDPPNALETFSRCGHSLEGVVARSASKTCSSVLPKLGGGHIRSRKTPDARSFEQPRVPGKDRSVPQQVSRGAQARECPEHEMRAPTLAQSEETNSVESSGHES